MSTYNLLDQRNKHTIDMRVLRRMEKFFNEDRVFYGRAVTTAVSAGPSAVAVGLPVPPAPSRIVRPDIPVNDTPAAVVGAPETASALGTVLTIVPLTVVVGAASSGHQGGSSTEAEPSATVPASFRVRTGQGMDGPLADNAFLQPVLR